MTDPRLYYLPDGRHICQICCEAKDHSDLQPVSPHLREDVDNESVRWDVCKECAIEQGGEW